jgi:beta-glucanase (GH16 family)
LRLQGRGSRIWAGSALGKTRRKMWKSASALGLLSALSLCAQRGEAAFGTTGRTMVWNDEFSGTALDTSIWNREVQPAYHYNMELQSYTNSVANSYVENGHLVLRLIEEAGKYTSARLNTKGKRDTKYGYVEVRAKVPEFRGSWPAVWFLTSTFPYGVWPNSGEIDLLESIGCEPGNLHQTVHCGVVPEWAYTIIYDRVARVSS